MNPRGRDSFWARLGRDDLPFLRRTNAPIQDQVSELPLRVNLVARERALIHAVLGDSWWEGTRLLRHVLAVEPLERWSTFVTRAFDEFIAEHTTYSPLQIRFLQTLRTLISQRGRVGRPELIEPPFTQLHPAGIGGVLAGPGVDEVVTFVVGLVA